MEASNIIQLILPYSGKQGKKLITDEETYQEKSTGKRTGDSDISKEKVVCKV